MSILRVAHTLLFLSSLALAQTTAQQAPAAAPVEPRPVGFITMPQCATHHSFLSPALQRQMSYCLLLPADYATSQRAYPVLYLLHGLFGSENDWLAKTRVADYARPLPIIIVMPEADDSWYTNSYADPRNRYEDYLFNDVIEEIDSHYRTLKTRDARFIAGLSMGGYGAIKAGLRHPEMFAMVGAFSSALDATRIPSRWITAQLAFGRNSDLKDDDYILLGKLDPTQLPYFFVTCGNDDPRLHESRELVSMMNSLRVHYEFHESPGAHTWPFWEHSLDAFLRELTPRLAPSHPESGPHQ